MVQNSGYISTLYEVVYGGKMKRIVTEFIPHHKQAYNTPGDYGETPENIWFKVSIFPGKPAYSIAILLHELSEFFRNKQEGISIESVDTFDREHPELDDPGLSTEAPYHRPHMESDTLERLFILFSGEDWVEYEAACVHLYKHYKDNFEVKNG
jgi:hypothetical protein